MSEFGNKFKSARESRNWTLDEISQKTRINARYLRAIENEEFQVLPGGLFNRGFIRSYANCVGLDSNLIVSEYKRLVNQGGADPSDLATNLSVETSERHLLPIALGSLVVLILLFYVFTQDTGLPTEAAVSPTTEAEASVRAAAVPAARPLLENPAPAIRSRPAEALTETDRPETTDNLPSVSVLMEVHHDTWVRVQSDGDSVVEGVIFRAGTTRTYSAAEALELTIGNAAGLSLSINGRQVPTLGGEGQVRTLTITPGNVDRFTGS